MKVTLSCSGSVSRPLRLAEAFDAAGELGELHIPFHSSPHPILAKALGVEPDAPTVSPERIRTHLTAALYRKWVSRHGAPTDPTVNLGWQALLDRRVAAALSVGSDVVFVESMIALETLGQARRTGAVAVLDRTNTHIRYQQRVVAEEYASLGVSEFRLHPAAGLARGEAEYEAADYVCTLSSFARDSFLEMGVPAEKLLLVPSATDLSAFRPYPREDGVFRVMTVGISSVKKGTHRLIEAFASLGLDDAELMLVGSEDPTFGALVSRFDGSYRRHGVVRHSELPRLLSQASVFVLPSIEEGMAKVVLEAMACGVPVIVTPNTGAGDVMVNGEDGLIVPAGDTNVLADGIARLHSDPALRERMGRSARERVSHGWSWEDYAGRMRSAFERIIA